MSWFRDTSLGCSWMGSCQLCPPHAGRYQPTNGLNRKSKNFCDCIGVLLVYLMRKRSFCCRSSQRSKGCCVFSNSCSDLVGFILYFAYGFGFFSFIAWLGSDWLLIECNCLSLYAFKIHFVGR
mmetsp:Transcript_61502/g.165248  ORF Transcript_61502/g.165248 Transcript_61502/m.165248 type:complete len:123 (+) Transcript_61502:629-997(+)